MALSYSNASCLPIPSSLSAETRARIASNKFSGPSLPTRSARALALRTTAVASRSFSSGTRSRETSSSADAVSILERTISLTPDVPGTPSAPGGSKRTLTLPEDELRSTPQQRLAVVGATVLFALLFAKGASEIGNTTEAVEAVAAFVGAYIFADFGSGVYHWGVDNYGDASTPVFGSQIAAFQGHHQRPWTITEREFCNNVAKVFTPTVPFSLACLAVSPWTPAALDIFLASATFLVAMSQQFHAWSHMKKSELHPVVVSLQEAGVLISRKMHGAHHKAPFEGNYCIVSGLCNPLLDGSDNGFFNGSDNGFFRRLERHLRDLTGVEPRCWHEPEYSWAEEIRPE